MSKEIGNDWVMAGLGDNKVVWTVRFTNRKTEKSVGDLPENVQDELAMLIRELRAEGPMQPEWKNFGKLGRAKGQPKNVERYHCHIGVGKPAYVAIWQNKKGTFELEVTHAGTHEKANRKYKKY